MVYTYGSGPRYVGEHAATISVPQQQTHNGMVEQGLQMNGAHVNYPPMYQPLQPRYMNLNVPVREPTPPPPEPQQPLKKVSVRVGLHPAILSVNIFLFTR